MRLSFCACHRAVFAAATDGSAAGLASRSPAAAEVDAALIEDIVLAGRICAAESVFDAFGHVSVRHPSAPDRFLMTKSIAPALALPEDVVQLDLDCIVCGVDTRPLFLERFIHGEIYKARPDVQSIIHSHSRSVIPFGLTDHRMQAMFHTAAFVAGGAPVFDIAEKFGPTDMLVGNPEKGHELARVLADKPLCLMRGHGSVVVGENLKHAVARAIYAEINAGIQLQTMSLGGPIRSLSTDEGILADRVNLNGVERPWQVWRKAALAGLRFDQQIEP